MVEWTKNSDNMKEGETVEPAEGWHQWNRQYDRGKKAAEEVRWRDCQEEAVREFFVSCENVCVD